jgi:hypothetical protein
MCWTRKLIFGHVDRVRLASQNHGCQRAYCSSAGRYVRVESHGDDDAGWGKLLTRPQELSGNPTSRDIWERVGGIDEGVRFCLSVSEIRQRIFNMPWNLTTWISGFASHKKDGVLRIFIGLKNPSPRAGFKPATLGSIDKPANHYTTEETNQEVSFVCLKQVPESVLMSSEGSTAYDRTMSLHRSCGELMR